ncbi:MAG: deoxyguanosinetriphosphate triphosphohydrolase, partial [Myxococcaceae bacterium]|nr:deoxyguanosinetriphosphate triphosphohydrolase [Myxococcaceae bacterium]
AKRLRRSEARASLSRAALTRSPFQQDADLVVFSASFRRLQDKTQVQPLAEGGRVRSRLTHSIEVASVGRSLGSAVAYALCERRALDAEQRHALAHVVHAACLAHDIGNVPFGHGGEDAIQAWFRAHPQHLAALTPEQAADFLAFDGNAQGFRTLTQLENYRFDGGLRLTHATLGALMKYAVSAHERDPTSTVLARKKPGFFSAERAYVEELTSELGLAPGARHPLVYLTEAADDICYAIVDLEDGYGAGLLDYQDAAEVLQRLAGKVADPSLARGERLQKLRGVAIGRLVDAVSAAFVEREPQLLCSESCPELCALTPLGSALAEAKALARERIYSAPAVVERLLGGQVILAALLDTFVPVAAALAEVSFERAQLRGRAASIAHLFGHSFAPRDHYEALLGVTDFLSALTDHAALTLQRRLLGVA